MLIKNVYAKTKGGQDLIQIFSDFMDWLDRIGSPLGLMYVIFKVAHLCVIGGHNRLFMVLLFVNDLNTSYLVLFCHIVNF